KAEAKSLAKAAQDRENTAKAVQQLKAGEDVLEATRNQFMQSGFGPFLQVANEFAKGILRTPLEFQHGEIGRVDEKGRWVSSATFSGTEAAVTHAAISAALGSQAPMRIVIVDELGRMDEDAKTQFIRNV